MLYMGICINYDSLYMVTEYLQKGSLFDLLHNRNVTLNFDKLFRLCDGIVKGMIYLHSRNVLHCDLKSSNILIDSDWDVKLGDFGLSHVRSAIDKRFYGRIGTPNWMAPEILRREKYDESSDVYSFGMVLWEMVTGNIPYANVPLEEMVQTVGFGNSRVEIPKKGPKLFLDIMRKCTNRERELRPSFKEIYEMLHTQTDEKERVYHVFNQLTAFFE
eukprot:TRINITY_DN10365_c0_g1_i1.p1 TRINITY_DN10365_c0_g1~~TRINITY_DN10365_c0_g1_i1.p1  ORF type:complete len:216 (+),score=37.84 TRINITY_DN10365_c0_g1_i1:299-946(+)